MPTAAHINRLINEKSPYLLQHAYNPVNWYPWGEEAFAKAKSENKPVFLSIGYSTCHWCHVMERESFEDEEVADLLNKSFICIKVDKEERPDIDSVYMGVCQAITGQGGWPLTILMTPDQKPFFAGTYFPKRARYHMPGVIELLTAVAEQWKDNSEKLMQSGDEIIKLFDQQQNSNKYTDLSEETIEKAKGIFEQSFDELYGGFANAPKFPTPHNFMFLLRYYHFKKEPGVLHMVEKTLQQMYRGGIFDHIGFGFSRYSTDRKWLAPHFEKMLYDNALLTIAYLETYQVTQNPLYKNVAVKIMEYVKRELLSEEGGFYCAQDADSDGVEGKYYLFTPDEVINVLGQEDGEYFNHFFDITEEGNFEGKNILNLIKNQDFDKENARIEKLVPKLYQYRLNRTSLHKDDKILTSWNALMITAFAKAYKILGDNSYLDMAKKAMTFIEDKLTDHEGNLHVRYRDGETTGNGHIDDYAFIVWALIEIYEATFNAEYLKKAAKINRRMMDLFFDHSNGGFYLYSKDSENLIYRPKELYDGAIPSGNSVAAYCLLKLAKLTGEPGLEDTAYQQLKFMAGNTGDYPAGYSFYLIALILSLYPSKELLCVIDTGSGLEKIKATLQNEFRPDITVLVKDKENQKILDEIAEFTSNYEIKEEKESYYICQGNSCLYPFDNIDELKTRL